MTTESTPNAAADPKPQPKSGKDARGRFTFGNHYGRENPHARRMAEHQSYFVKMITPEIMALTFQKLLEHVTEGSLSAIRLLLQYAMGKPTNVVNPDQLDNDEWEIRKGRAVDSNEFTTVSTSLQTPMANGLNEALVKHYGREGAKLFDKTPGGTAPQPPTAAPSPTDELLTPSSVSPSPTVFPTDELAPPPTVSPSPTVFPTDELAPPPTVSPSPTVFPTGEPAPPSTVTPSPTVFPTDDPAAPPTVSPSPMVVPTGEPAAPPTVTPSPTVFPTGEPKASVLGSPFASGLSMAVMAAVRRLLFGE